jgi:hypothetical protein
MMERNAGLPATLSVSTPQPDVRLTRPLRQMTADRAMPGRLMRSFTCSENGWRTSGMQ